MRKMNLWLFTAILLISALGIRYLLPGNTATEISAERTPQVEEKALPTFSSNTVKYGSYGQDVYELQGRLKYLGFYNGKIDSNFGSSTLKSVKWFQSEFGMKADGVVGAETKLKLYNASTKWSPTEPPLHKESSGGGGGSNNTAIKSKTIWDLPMPLVSQRMNSRLWLTLYMVKPGVNRLKVKSQ